MRSDEATRRLTDRREVIHLSPYVWIASLSLAMTGSDDMWIASAKGLVVGVDDGLRFRPPDHLFMPLLWLVDDVLLLQEQLNLVPLLGH